MDAPRTVNQPQRRGTGNIRKTVNISLPPDLDHFARCRAEERHGNNVSHYFQTLVRSDRERIESDTRETADERQVA